MIPDFDENGKLPVGKHSATIAEFKERFANNIKRRSLYSGLLVLIEDLKRIKCTLIYVDGSYVTSTDSPKDIDVCWDDKGIDYDTAPLVSPALFNISEHKLRYKADVFPAYFLEEKSQIFFIDFFQLDKLTGKQKGIVELKL